MRIARCKMSENDIIAEYVKSRFPSLLATVDFGLYKMGVGIGETLNGMSKCLKNIDLKALKERLESVKEQEKTII
jgi:hypothetical protein